MREAKNGTLHRLYRRRPIFFFIAGIAMFFSLDISCANAELYIQSFYDYPVKLYGRGYYEKSIFFESSENLNIKEFDWVAVSCNGSKRKLEVKNFLVNGRNLEVVLHEKVPCGGRVVDISYRPEKKSGKKISSKVQKERTRKKKSEGKNSKHASVSKPVGVMRHISSSNHRHESEFERRICAVFGKRDCAMAIAIAKAESGKNLNPVAIGDMHLSEFSYGLFQINTGYHNYSPRTLLNANENIRAAKNIYDKDGWNAWSAYKNGSYKKYLR